MMRANRILNTVEDEWGRSIVYSTESTGALGQKKTEAVVEPTRTSNIAFKDKPESSTECAVEQYYNNTNDEDAPDCEYVDEEKYRLPYLQALLLATVLEDTITQLRILASCNTEMKISKTNADMPLLLALKFGVKQPAVMDELDGVDHNRLGCDEYKLNKLDSDRNFLGSVLEDTYIDLCLSKIYMALVEHNAKITDREDYRVFINEDESRNRGLRRELAKQLRQQRNHFKSVIYDTDVIIDSLKTQVEDAALNGSIRSRYVDNWQNARTEQHLQTVADKESVPAEAVDYYKTRSDHEQRVHSEVELLINIAINETLEKVESWMDKYDKDMEAIDLRIQIKKNDYQNMLDRRIDLEKTIATHDELMKNWIHFKDEREKARQYRDKMTKSAITVQAWWRGLLVRLQLGPYKVPKKKGGGAKKK